MKEHVKERLEEPENRYIWLQKQSKEKNKSVPFPWELPE